MIINYDVEPQNVQPGSILLVACEASGGQPAYSFAAKVESVESDGPGVWVIEYSYYAERYGRQTYLTGEKVFLDGQMADIMAVGK